ncbi:MAG: reverse transcriptase domain-containing protein [Spirosomataceae bacterium]
MEFTTDEIQTIKTALQSGKNLADLTNLLNLVGEWIAQKLVLEYKPFSIKQVYHYYYNLESKYKEHRISKKSGGERVIHAPEETLKRIQRRLNVILSHLYEPTEAAHGFVMNRSIVSNAQPHVSKKNVFNLDLQDFFPTIHFGRIKAVLQLPEYGFTSELAHIVANFCCFQGKLPQGSPVSPILTNIVCRRMDYRISGLAAKHGFTYTRYADDITLSFDELSNEAKQKMGFGLGKILKEEGFIVNSKKTRLLTPNQRQEVTGVVVNKKLNVNRRYIRSIRAILHNWQKHGLEATQARFIDFYPQEKGYKLNRTIPDLRKVLFGKIQFWGMVRGGNDKVFKRLIEKYKMQ